MRRRSASVESENQFVFGQTGPSHSDEPDGAHHGDALLRAKQRCDGNASRRSFQLTSRPLNAKTGSVPTEYLEDQQTNLAGSDYLTAEAQHCKNKSEHAFTVAATLSSDCNFKDNDVWR